MQLWRPSGSSREPEAIEQKKLSMAKENPDHYTMTEGPYRGWRKKHDENTRDYAAGPHRRMHSVSSAQGRQPSGPGMRLPATTGIGQQRHLHAVLEELTEDRVEGYVLLSQAAFEYPSIDRARVDGSVRKGLIRLESGRLDHHTPPGGGSYYSWGSPVIFRKVVADHGDVVEVNTTLEYLPESLGHGGKGADYLYELRTFLRKIDLVPVLKRPLMYKYDDGTSINLFPGTAVGLPWCGDDTQRAVSVEHLHFELPVPDDYLAFSFTPKLREDLHADAMPMLADGVRLVLNGASWRAPASFAISNYVRQYTI